MAEKHGKLYDLFLTAKGIELNHRMLKHSQYWDLNKLGDYQFNHMSSLLVHAFENTQYYRNLFLEIGFNPYRDFTDIKQLAQLPLLTQSKARQEKEKLADGRKLKSAIELRTSGTTGEPFISYASAQHWIMEQGVTWRHWNWMGYRFRDRMAILRSYVPKENDPLWKVDKLRNFYYLSAYHISEDNASEYVAKLRSWRIKYLRGYPSSLYLLAKVMNLKSLEIDPPKAILTASETLLPHYRKTLEETFGAPVFDWYGLGEPATTMMECEKHEGLHINMEYGFCELLEDPCLPKNQRRIVATSLHNLAMPLIRYETKDIAIVDAHTTCSCGRSLPLVKGIQGRSDDFLYGSQGRVLPSVNFYTLFYQYPELLRFQIVQESLEEMTVYILYSDSWSRSRREQLIRDLKDRVGLAIHITILENQPFIQSGEGKTPVIIQRVKDVSV